MSIRTNKRANGTYFLQKRVCFIWFDCTNEDEIDSLFSDGFCESFEFEYLVENEAKRLIKKRKEDKEWSKKYDDGMKLDTTYKIKQYR